MPTVKCPEYYDFKTSTYRRNKNIRWRDLSFKEFSKIAIRRGSVLGALGLTGLVFHPDGPVDITGDKGRVRTQQERAEIARIQRDKIFADETLSPEYRYLLSFIGSEAICGSGYCENYSISFNGIEGNNGILGVLSTISNFGQLDVNSRSPAETCLAGTAYDTSPSEIRGRAKGDVSAAASLKTPTINGEEVIHVNPSSTGGSVLKLRIAPDGYLEPYDAAAVDILSSYGSRGCDLDLRD